MSEGRSRIGLWALKLVDGFQYAVALNGLVVALVGPLVLLATGSLVALKWILFVLGLPMMAYGSLKLRPAIREDHESALQVDDSHTVHGFGARVGRLPPVSLFDPASSEHLSDGGRIMLAGFGAWAVSFLLEAALGVGVPATG